MDYYFSEKGFKVCRIDGSVKLDERRRQVCAKVPKFCIFIVTSTWYVQKLVDLCFLVFIKKEVHWFVIIFIMMPCVDVLHAVCCGISFPITCNY